MDIEKEISELESIIEQYEDTNNPEDRMDFRQTAQKKIKNLLIILLKISLQFFVSF